MQNRMQQHLMFSLSFHANFIDPNTHMLEFSLGDLDRQSDDSKFGLSLRLAKHFEILLLFTNISSLVKFTFGPFLSDIYRPRIQLPILELLSIHSFPFTMDNCFIKYFEH